jgi:hypothetical protein
MVDLRAFWHETGGPKGNSRATMAFRVKISSFVITDFQGVITVWKPVITRASAAVAPR